MADRARERELMEQAIEEKQEESKAKAEESQIASASRPQDEQSPRAKSSGKGKKTADKWNQ
jgi:hypothetical protein